MFLLLMFSAIVKQFLVFTYQAVQHLQDRQEDHLNQEVLSRPLVLKNTNETLVEFMYANNQNTLKTTKTFFMGRFCLCRVD